ncbi:ribosome assembly factor SBDS [Candidatus Woesearchaeota archaeon]|nr:ribosome assembly factor SBDS [Candidatus Woesearchaeota archaeon]
MTDLDKAVIARLKKGVEEFEVFVDCERAIAFRNGAGKINDVLVAEYIYKDAKKGLHASEHEMEKFFETKEVLKVAEKIVKEGNIQLTKEYRNKLRDEKRKKIIELIRLNTVDSKTGLPHPIVRIENAIEEARVSIDEMKNAEDQLSDVVNKLREVLPIKFEIKKYEIKIPARFAGTCYGTVKRFSKINNEDWQNDGSLVVEIEIAPGMIEEIFGQLNKMTHGDIESKEI